MQPLGLSFILTNTQMMIIIRFVLYKATQKAYNSFQCHTFPLLKTFAAHLHQSNSIFFCYQRKIWGVRKQMYRNTIHYYTTITCELAVKDQTLKGWNYSITKIKKAINQWLTLKAMLHFEICDLLWPNREQVGTTSYSLSRNQQLVQAIFIWYNHSGQSYL